MECKFTGDHTILLHVTCTIDQIAAKEFELVYGHNLDIKKRIMTPDSMVKKKCKQFSYGILPVLIIFFIVLSGCTGTERIGRDHAVLIALNDSKMLSIIDNNSYTVTDTSVAHLSIGGQASVELYSVTIDVLNGTNRRGIAFISYEGKVIQVDNAYPPARLPADRVNASMMEMALPLTIPTVNTSVSSAVVLHDYGI